MNLKREESTLLRYFLEDYDNRLSAAASNDMPKEFWANFDESSKAALLKDFNEWDKVANPDGWVKVSSIEKIFDFEWVGFLKNRVIQVEAL